MAISQQAKHSCFTNNLIVGDSIRYDLVDIEKLCIPENDESTWDFSNLKYLGKEREESFYGKDSAKCMSAIRRFHSLRSFHPRLFTFAPFGDGRMLLAKVQYNIKRKHKKRVCHKPMTHPFLFENILYFTRFL